MMKMPLPVTKKDDVRKFGINRFKSCITLRRLFCSSLRINGYLSSILETRTKRASSREKTQFFAKQEYVWKRSRY